MQKHPLLANPHMAEVLHDRVKAAQRAVYYKCLKAAVCGKDFEINNRSDTETLTSNLPIKKEVFAVKHNPFVSKHRGRCPHCLKVADVSQFIVFPDRDRFRIKCSHCKKKRSIWNWFCLSAQEKMEKKQQFANAKDTTASSGLEKVKKGQKAKAKVLPNQSRQRTTASSGLEKLKKGRKVKAKVLPYQSRRRDCKGLPSVSTSSTSASQIVFTTQTSFRNKAKTC